MIEVVKPNLSMEDKQSVLSCMDREWLGMGKDVFLFEEKVSSLLKVDVDKVVAVSTCTHAIEAALKSTKRKKGSKVLLPSLNYVGVIQAVLNSGYVPVLCDVDEHLVLTENILKKYVKTVDIVLPLDYSGSYCDIKTLKNVCDDNNLSLIHDAAHTFGSYTDINVTTTFSFDAIKTFTCIDGGIVICETNEQADYIRKWRNVGTAISPNLLKKHEKINYKGVDEEGDRTHLSNVHACLGISQLSRFDYTKSKRKQLSDYYDNNISNDYLIQKTPNDLCRFIYVIRCKENRNILVNKLLDAGIKTSWHWQPLHTMPMFKSYAKTPLFYTDEVSERLVTIPFYTELTKQDQDKIIECIKD